MPGLWLPGPVPFPQHLRPWIKSPRGHERERALGVSACLLQYFLEHLQVSVSTLSPRTQSCLWDSRLGDCRVWPSCPKPLGGLPDFPVAAILHLSHIPASLVLLETWTEDPAGPEIVLRASLSWEPVCQPGLMGAVVPK